MKSAELKVLVLAPALFLLSCGSSAPPVAPSTSWSATATPPPTQTANHAPTVSINPVEPGGVALTGGTRVAFGANASDPDGDPLTYTWDFDDGTTGDGPGVAHVFESEGAFRVTVTVSD